MKRGERQQIFKDVSICEAICFFCFDVFSNEFHEILNAAFHNEPGLFDEEVVEVAVFFFNEVFEVILKLVVDVGLAFEA